MDLPWLTLPFLSTALLQNGRSKDVYKDAGKGQKSIDKMVRLVRAEVPKLEAKEGISQVRSKAEEGKSGKGSKGTDLLAPVVELSC